MSASGSDRGRCRRRRRRRRRSGRQASGSAWPGCRIAVGAGVGVAVGVGRRPRLRFRRGEITRASVVAAASRNRALTADDHEGSRRLLDETCLGWSRRGLDGSQEQRPMQLRGCGGAGRSVSDVHAAADERQIRTVGVCRLGRSRPLWHTGRRRLGARPSAHTAGAWTERHWKRRRSPQPRRSAPDVAGGAPSGSRQSRCR